MVKYVDLQTRSLCLQSETESVSRSVSHVWLSVTPWTITCQALAWEFSRHEYWGGQPFPSPGDLTNLGIEPVSLASPAMQADSLLSEPLGKPKELANRSRTVVGFGSFFATFYEILQERWAERRFWFASRDRREWRWSSNWVLAELTWPGRGPSPAWHLTWSQQRHHSCERDTAEQGNRDRRSWGSGSVCRREHGKWLGSNRWEAYCDSKEMMFPEKPHQ